MFSDLLEKKTKDFPLILTRVHFTRNSHGNFFYREIPLLFFPTFKLEIEFHSHKKVVSPKLENSENLFIVYFKCAKFWIARSLTQSVAQSVINSASVYGTYLRRLTLQVSRLVPT